MTTREYFKQVFGQDEKCPACNGVFDWDVDMDFGECKSECKMDTWVYNHDSVDDLKREIEARNAGGKYII